MAQLETGKLICELRKMKNLTQKELANYLNVSDKAVSKWERGESYPEITIIPQLAGILEITVDELLNGKRKIAVPEGENDEEKNYAYACLLEDAGNRFLQNTIIAFLVIVIGIMVRATGLIYSVLVAAVIGIGGAIFYCFSLNKYKTSQQRIQRYWKFSDQKDDIYYKIKHSIFFIVIPLIILFTDIIHLIIFKACTLNIYTINNRKLYISYGGSYIGYFLILTAAIVSLYIFYNMYNQNMSNKLFKCNHKILITTLISSLITVVLFYAISIFKIFTIVLNNYNESIINLSILVAAVLLAAISILLFKKYYKERSNVFWIGLIFSIIQFLLLIYISNSRIAYYGWWADNINLGDIDVHMLIIDTLICSVTINYATNYLFLNNKQKIFKRK
jgi:transcriptional regulator with XRE-family HTH domain